MAFIFCNFIYLNNYFNLHVCLFFRLPLPSACLKTSSDSCSLIIKLQIKVAWYVLRVKNMYSGSPSPPSGTSAAEAKPRYVYSISKPHGRSFRRQVRLLLSEDYTWQVNFRFTPFLHHLPSVGPKQLCALAHLGCTREAGTS